MKKLLWTIFIATTLIACGDSNNEEDDSQTPPPGVSTTWLGDWNNDEDDAYKPEYQAKYNPISDEWKVVKKNGREYKDMLLYRFSAGKSWNYATHMHTEAPDFDPFWRMYYNRSEYKINDKQLMFKDGAIFEYSLTLSKTEDKLQIYDGRDTWELVPYTDSWTWKSDWNDPFDRHYTIYQGKYNPLAGTWKLTHENEIPLSGSSIYYYIFDSNFKRSYSNDGINFKFYRDYSINNSKIKVKLDKTTEEYKYYLNKDTLITIYKEGSYILNERFLKIE